MRANTIVMLVILLIVLIIVGFFTADPQAGQQVLIDLGLSEPVATQYTASGLLEAQMYTLSGETGGKVVDLLVDEGDEVESGQLLLQLEAILLATQVEMAQAKVEAAQALVDMLDNAPRQVDLAVANALVAQAQAAVDGAQQALEDTEDSPPSVIRDEQVALAQAQVDQAQAQRDAAQATLTALEKGASTAERQAAQAALQASQAELAALENQLAHQTIRAPIDGTVLQTLLLPGELALSGWPLITIADLSELRLTVYVPEADLNWAQVGQRVNVVIDAFPERQFLGEVVHIADQAEFTPRNVQTPEERTILVYAVEVQLANPDNVLKPGLPADVIFEVQP